MADTKRTEQIRISIWLDREDYLDFNRLYPVHGAFTTFVRKALALRLKKITSEIQELTDERNTGT